MATRRRIIDRLRLRAIATYALCRAPGSTDLVVHLALPGIGTSSPLERVELTTSQQHNAGHLTINPHGVVATFVIGGVPRGEAPSLATRLEPRLSRKQDCKAEGATVRV